MKKVDLVNREQLFANINIGIHNINRLKDNHYKAQELIDLGIEMKYNIIGIVETNIKEIEGKFLRIDRKGYSTFWSNAEKNKHKGSGVGIWIDSKWNEHLASIQRPNAYSIRASFRFKKAIITIWIIYIPPNNKEKANEVQRVIMKDIMLKQKDEHFIIRGDFNKILNIETDRIGRSMSYKIKKLALII